jgi:hypothetical protein
MASSADGRGSGPQRHLFDLAKQLYSKYSVVYEQEIPSLGLRFDIFIKELGVAIEYDGRQHEEYVEHFHKDINGYICSINRDRRKIEFCLENGIKLVRLKGEVEELGCAQLLNVIESFPYPDSEYSFESLRKEERRDLVKAKEFRAKRYLEGKNNRR